MVAGEAAMGTMASSVNVWYQTQLTTAGSQRQAI